MSEKAKIKENEVRAGKADENEPQGLSREKIIHALNERNRFLGSDSTFAIYSINPDGRIKAVSDSSSDSLSLFFGEDLHSVSLFKSKSRILYEFARYVRQCMDHNKSRIVDIPFEKPNGDHVHLRICFTPVSDTKGTITEVIAVVEDISLLRRTEHLLEIIEKRYRVLFQSAPIALVEWDASLLKAHLEQLVISGISDFKSYLEDQPSEVHHCWSLIKTVDYNKAFLELMGISDTEEFRGDFIPTESEDFIKMAREVILLAAEGSTTNEREETILTTKAGPKIVLAKSLVLSGHEDTLARVVISLVDISKRKKAEEALRNSERRFREQALRDNLTGLYNRRFLYQSLSMLIERSRKTDSLISLIFLDLDHFKRIVDSYGHLNGSLAIQKVARTINDCLQEPDYAVAYAGDEFVVVLPGRDQKGALQKAKEIRSQIKNTVYVLDEGIEVRIQASFGVATYPYHASNMNELIAAADHALFDIKEKGKDAVGLFE